MLDLLVILCILVLHCSMGSLSFPSKLQGQKGAHFSGSCYGLLFFPVVSFSSNTSCLLSSSHHSASLLYSYSYLRHSTSLIFILSPVFFSSSHLLIFPPASMLLINPLLQTSCSCSQILAFKFFSEISEKNPHLLGFKSIFYNHAQIYSLRNILETTSVNACAL